MSLIYGRRLTDQQGHGQVGNIMQVPRAQEWGWASKPPAQTPILILSPDDNPNHSVVIKTYDGAPMELNEGEVGVYTGKTRIILHPDATLSIHANGGVSIDGTVTVNGDLRINGGITVRDDVITDRGISQNTHWHNTGGVRHARPPIIPPLT